MQLSEDDIRYLAALARQIRGIRGNGVTVTPTGITIHGPQSRRPPVLPDGWMWIRITTATSGDSNYTGRLQRAKTGGVLDSHDDLTPSDWLEDISKSDDCILAVSTDSGHSLKTDGTEYMLARFIRMSDDDSPLPVYATSGGGGGVGVGQYQYQTMTMVSQNQSGWDFTRAHPLI